MNSPSGALDSVAPTKEVVIAWTAAIGRILLGGIFLAAGLIKLLDQQGSLLSVINYQIVSYELARVLSAALPVFEIALALLLVAGFWTRPASIVAGVVLLGFVAAIVSVWVRGIAIDCGCFGSNDAPVDAVRGYVVEVVRDVALLAICALVWWRGGQAVSLDSQLNRTGRTK